MKKLIIMLVLCLSVVAQGALLHRYSFNDGTADDSIGGVNGTLEGNAMVSGGQLVLDGSGYVDLPGAIINVPGFTEITIEGWFTIDPTAGNWSKLYTFGATTANGGANYLLGTAIRGDGTGTTDITISDADPGWMSETMVPGPVKADGIQFHYAGVIDATSVTLYIDGVQVGTTALGSQTLDQVSNALAYLGKSVYPDPDLIGSIDEFRIWDTALGDAYFMDSFLAGSDTVIPEPATLALLGLGAFFVRRSRKR